MAFTFNWAGVSVNPISVRYDSMDRAASDAGAALRGFEVRKANEEYADMVESDDRASARIKEIDSELDFLRGRLSSLEYQKRITTTRTAMSSRWTQGSR